MAIPVIMPRLGQSVESCIIAKWYKKKGEPVKTGDLLFAYETDKAAFEEEAKADGTLLEIFFAEGEDVPVLTNVCVIGNAGEDISALYPAGQRETPSVGKAPEATVPASAAASPAVTETMAQTDSYTGSGERMKISPRARNLAEKAGIDYHFAQPTGPYGRVVERDIMALQSEGPRFTRAALAQAGGTGAGLAKGSGLGGRITTGDLEQRRDSKVSAASSDASVPEFEETKLSNIRKVIAKAMHQSLANTAQLTLHTSFDASDILAFRRKLKTVGASLGLDKITVTDIILYAVSRTILNHRTMNAHFLDDRMLVFNHVHLGVAVDTERGLMVPVIDYIDKRSLSDISVTLKELAESCQKGTINPDALKGGSFTLTNLGGLDIEVFTPVLNPPQVGILGVNNIIQRPREVNGKIEHYPAMGLSLTFDHRALDGAPAARFLKDVKQYLENFSLNLALPLI